MEQLATCFQAVLNWPVWDYLVSVGNSNFTSALAGALAGALIAHRIAERSSQRESLLKELRSTNGAIMLSFSIANAGLSLKKQFVKGIYSEYREQAAAFETFRANRNAGQISQNQPFDLHADFRTLQMPLVPTDLLRTQVIEGVSLAGRPLTAAMSLAGAVDSLRDTIANRNRLIERFRALGPEGKAQLPALYFGLPFSDGQTSTEFPDTVEALHTLTDDVIFFSELLGRDLMAHGDEILEALRKVAKVKKEQVSRIDFSDAHQQGLMPDSSAYTDWLKGFKRNT